MRKAGAGGCLQLLQLILEILFQLRHRGPPVSPYRNNQVLSIYPDYSIRGVRGRGDRRRSTPWRSLSEPGRLAGSWNESSRNQAIQAEYSWPRTDQPHKKQYTPVLLNHDVVFVVEATT
jgi:hypothetical protein